MRELFVYRFGRRTPCCDRIVRHIDADRILCRGCGQILPDPSAGVLEAFPGTLDATSTHAMKDG